MSISRAFTTRKSRAANESTPEMPKRSLTTKHSLSSSGTIRHKISAPIELISTTNMLSYNAPDIFPSSSSTSSNSGDDSDRSPSSSSTPLTSPDTSSIESSSPTSPQPNHLSCYFSAASRQSASSDGAPTIPSRAPSHTKKNSEIIAKKRSMSRVSGSTGSRGENSTSTARSSINMFSSHVDTVDSHSHPFGKELAQVSEIAEEYGISKEKLAVVDEEEQELVSRGLLKFRADDYISEIQGLFMSAFADSRPPMSSMWI
ncbi:uncharacterized protein K444DRAFT_545413 [Hyaloscypha bicolor E]|uniref:Uncharacterized protein n=1 Tax=Hyaloscypha bicolor E TaxID=1095630 RepID=A0A2J6SMU3_9HELO|nr:uncharacterized protein K444DRAFT_545413 [Hyaloscypha bicolor E]PMD52096.1 hypothetical protein K444DRAFT_545413 [Hyaloscypha bicolor E]